MNKSIVIHFDRGSPDSFALLHRHPEEDLKARVPVLKKYHRDKNPQRVSFYTYDSTCKSGWSKDEWPEGLRLLRRLLEDESA